MSSQVSGLMFLNFVSLVVDRGCQDGGGLKDNIWLETKKMYILCGPVSVPLQKVPEEDRCVGIAHGQL